MAKPAEPCDGPLINIPLAGEGTNMKQQNSYLMHTPEIASAFQPPPIKVFLLREYARKEVSNIYKLFSIRIILNS